MTTSERLVIVLAIIAAVVAVIQCRTAVTSGGVWWVITLYWVVLTVKNVVDARKK